MLSISHFSVAQAAQAAQKSGVWPPEVARNAAQAKWLFCMGLVDLDDLGGQFSQLASAALYASIGSTVPRRWTDGKVECAMLKARGVRAGVHEGLTQ